MNEERWINVACDCFREGRTTPPPHDVSELMLDSVGNVSMLNRSGAWDSQFALEDWVLHRACAHEGMRAFETIPDADWEYKHPLLAHYADEFKRSAYPALKSVLARPP